MGRAAPDVPDGMRGIDGRFARWRKSHTGRLPIPESLWSAAAEVAREYGVFRTSKVLRLEYGKLKRLAKEAHRGGPRTVRQDAPSAAFMELLTSGTGGGTECLIEPLRAEFAAGDSAFRRIPLRPPGDHLPPQNANTYDAVF
jgi:hypothetical protein